MGFSLPNSQPRPLTEAEITLAKDLLLARAAAGSKGSAAKTPPALTVGDAQCIPALEAAVQGLLEVRSLKPEAVTRPFREGVELPAAAQPVKEPFDAWLFPSEPRSDNSSHKTILLIPSTLEKRDCQICLGKGSAPCRNCFGKGVGNCDLCMGAGSQPCSVCRGLGKNSCPDCEGTGKIKSGGMTNKLLGPCMSCSGQGKFPCNHCAGGKVDCGGCANSGKKACIPCEGKGRAVCASCQGTSKLLVGQGIAAEFRPQQAAAAGLAMAAPAAAVSAALSQKTPAPAAEFPTEKDLSDALAMADWPEGLKSVVEQALQRIRPPSLSARLSRIKVSLSIGEIWRLSGTYAGHEFIYWVHAPTKHVTPEKDPLKEVSQKSSETASDALKRGDWEVAIDAAKETLTLDPDHPEARAIAVKWRRRLSREFLLVGAVVGGLGALLLGGGIMLAEKGLHRFFPAVFSAALSFLLCFGAAGALLPVTRHLFPAKKRLMASGGAAAGALLIFFILVKGLMGWDPVKSADQKSLNREMGDKFKFGVGKVYYAPDMVALQGLYEKYKNSRADLSAVNEGLESQSALKAELEKMTREFQEKLDAVLTSTTFLPRKRAQLEELRDYYSLRSVDVAAAERAIKDIDEMIKKGAVAPAAARSRGTISITPSRKAAPARGGSAKIKPAPAKKSAAKAAPKKKTKKITPAKEPDPKKKKKVRRPVD